MEPRPKGNVTILYILGSGRSGSTVLERSLVNAIDGAVGVGELRWLWDRGIGEDYLCSCTKPFHSCEFWQRVLERFRVGSSTASVTTDADRMIALRRRIERLRYTPFLISPRFAPAAYRQDLRSY